MTSSRSLNLRLRRAFMRPFIIADVKSAIIGTDFLVHYNLHVDVKGQSLIDPLTTLNTRAGLEPALEHDVPTTASHDLSHGIYGEKLS